MLNRISATVPFSIPSVIFWLFLESIPITKSPRNTFYPSWATSPVQVGHFMQLGQMQVLGEFGGLDTPFAPFAVSTEGIFLNSYKLATLVAG